MHFLLFTMRNVIFILTVANLLSSHFRLLINEIIYLYNIYYIFTFYMKLTLSHFKYLCLAVSLYMYNTDINYKK